MRAICVNTSKPRMLHFFVHYLEARWPGFVDNLDEVLVDNIAKTEADSDVLQWMDSDFSFLM